MKSSSCAYVADSRRTRLAPGGIWQALSVLPIWFSVSAVFPAVSTVAAKCAFPFPERGQQQSTTSTASGSAIYPGSAVSALPGARPHDRSADFVCPDFHGARHLGRPSGCYQFPRTSFRSIVIVALCPATTAGLLTDRIPQPLSTRLDSGSPTLERSEMYRLFNVAEPTPESMRVAPVSKGLPVTASGAASDVLAADCLYVTSPPPALCVKAFRHH